MIQQNLYKLSHLIDIIPPLLQVLEEKSFKAKPMPDKWSKQEILGHLIDSATNNHQRFVRSQFEATPIISYNQNEWNKHGFYNQFDKAQLIEFWKYYNRQIFELVKLIPSANLKRECNTGGKENYTLEFIFNDYVDHLEYHLKQIVIFDDNPKRS